MTGHRAWRACRNVLALSLLATWLTSFPQLAWYTNRTTNHYVSPPSDVNDHGIPLVWYWNYQATIGCEVVTRGAVWLGPDIQAPQRLPPTWSGGVIPPTRSDLMSPGLAGEVASGWPFRSAMSEHHIVDGSSTITRWGIPVFRAWQPWSEPPRSIPLRPIWLGLLGNTLFWSWVVAPAYWGAIGWRTARRRRRALCVNCKYPVQSLTRCPECGTDVREVFRHVRK